MRIPVVIPDKIEARSFSGVQSMNHEGPIDLTLEPMYVTWLKQEGEEVKKGEVIVEGEVQKRIVLITAPCSGKLAKVVKEDGWMCSAREVLGYIDEEM